MSKLKIFICDIDGTLANISHRLHFIESKPKDWNGFFDAMDKDLPIQPVIDLVKILQESLPVFYVTGRPARYKEQTIAWLNENKLSTIGHIFNRADGDHRPDDEIKREIYRGKIKPKFDVQFVLDDRDRVVQMWRDEGLLCLQVASGDF